MVNLVRLLSWLAFSDGYHAESSLIIDFIFHHERLPIRFGFGGSSFSVDAEIMPSLNRLAISLAGSRRRFLIL